MAREARFLARAGNAGGYPRLLEARRQHDFWARLPGIDVPVLAIAGEYDDQAPLAHVKAMADALPNARLHVYPNGHDVLFATAEPAEAIIRAWC